MRLGCGTGDTAGMWRGHRRIEQGTPQDTETWQRLVNRRGDHQCWFVASTGPNGVGCGFLGLMGRILDALQGLVDLEGLGKLDDAFGSVGATPILAPAEHIAAQTVQRSRG